MLQINQLCLQRKRKLLFDKANVTIFHKQKVGLTGANGCGKSTLFDLILGQLQADDGEINFPTDLAIAHLAQETPALDTLAIDYVIDGDKQLRQLQAQLVEAETQGNDAKVLRLHEELAHIDAHTAISRAAALLSGLGFAHDEHTKAVKSFSGGWRMRLNLAQCLMARSDLLLLDEPTNHLDLDTILWLEKWMKNYPGTLIVISHDRDFLDNTVDHIIHVEKQAINLYKGNYSAFEKLRAEALSHQQALYERQQQQIKHMMSYVERFRYKASKAKQAQSRLKAIERIDVLSQAQLDSPFHFEFKAPQRCSPPLVKLSDVRLAYGEETILDAVNLQLLPESRIGLLGPNGAGKSTLIKGLIGQIKISKGERFQATNNLKIAHYAQHQLEQLVASQSPIQHIQQLSPKAREQEIRDHLGGFNFKGDMATHSIEHFSGGEKSRPVLALLVWQKPNLLLLDEPTNHLDLTMRSALELALQSYQGALIVISHDRHFLRSCVDEFYLVANHKVQAFNGDLDDYKQWLTQYKRNQSAGGDLSTVEKAPPQDHKARRAQQNRLKKLEQLIHDYTEKKKSIEQELARDELYEESKKEVLAQLLQQQTTLEKQLLACEEEWFTLSEE